MATSEEFEAEYSKGCIAMQHQQQKQGSTFKNITMRRVNGPAG